MKKLIQAHRELIEVISCLISGFFGLTNMLILSTLEIFRKKVSNY